METIIYQLSKELHLNEKQVKTIIELIDEGNTIPFIARYRKEMTGGVSDEVLRDFDNRLKYIRNLEMRKEEVIKSITDQDKMTKALKSKIEKAEKLQEVEDLYRPFKKKKATRASKARDMGLEPLAEVIFNQDMLVGDFEALAKTYVNLELGVKNVQGAIKGAQDIIAERIADEPAYRQYIRDYDFKYGVMTAKATDPKERSVYEMYYEYVEKIVAMPNHRILAINRGEKEKILKVKIESPDESLCDYLKKQVISEPKAVTTAYLEAALLDSYKRLIMPSIEREIRSFLTERAEEEAIKVFGKNTKPLLLVPPVKNARVLGVDPSFRTGCKLVALDETGKLLDYQTIYPNAPQFETKKSKKAIEAMIKKYDLNLIAIGNGTASRETEQVVSETLKAMDKEVFYTIVSEAGASVYSASKLAQEEYPDLDVSIRGAISIGRRLQDPLAELVKIDPKSIGVGQYQHDVNQKKLNLALTGVVEDCVNGVGVDLNLATPALLQYVSGISSTVAKNIVAYRDENGKFNSRKELKKVKRLGDKVYEQCAGFLRISEGTEPLDQTGVHPETYPATLALIQRLGYSEASIREGALSDIDKKIADIGSVNQPLKKVKAKGFAALANLKEDPKKAKTQEKANYERGLKIIAEELSIGLMTLRDIVQEIKKPGRDIREGMPQPIFRSDVLSMKDLKVDMIMTGTVRNVVDFGAFVDIGVKQDGLVHVSEITDRFIKHPMEALSVGDQVEVKIIKIDKERQKISLSMKGL